MGGERLDMNAATPGGSSVAEKWRGDRALVQPRDCPPRDRASRHLRPDARLQPTGRYALAVAALSMVRVAGGPGTSHRHNRATGPLHSTSVLQIGPAPHTRMGSLSHFQAAARARAIGGVCVRVPWIGGRGAPERVGVFAPASPRSSARCWPLSAPRGIRTSVLDIIILIGRKLRDFLNEKHERSTRALGVAARSLPAAPIPPAQRPEAPVWRQIIPQRLGAPGRTARAFDGAIGHSRCL